MEKVRTIVHSQYNSPINLYSSQNIEETLRQQVHLVTKDIDNTLPASLYQQQKTSIQQQQENYRHYREQETNLNQASYYSEANPSVNYQPSPRIDYSTQSSVSYNSQEQHTQHYTQPTPIHPSKPNLINRQSSQERIREEYLSRYQEEYLEESRSIPTSNQIKSPKVLNQPNNQQYRSNFQINSQPNQRPKDTRVFAANYRKPSPNINQSTYIPDTDYTKPSPPVPHPKPYQAPINRQDSKVADNKPETRRQVSLELELKPSSKASQKQMPGMLQGEYQQDYYQKQRMDEQQKQQELYQQQFRQQQLLEDHYRKEQEKRNKEKLLQNQYNNQQYNNFHDPNEGYQPQMNDNIAPSNKPLVLHVGDRLVQFPSKMPDPNRPKLPEAPHLGEEKNVFVKGTVLQFPSNIPDPNQKLPEWSHLGEENQNLQLHQGSVVQFPKNVKDPRDKRGFQPPEEVVKEALPTADVEHPDHLLPSEARKQQTYITHPMHQPLKMMTSMDSPGSRRRAPVWPPTKSSIKELPKVGFNSGHIHPEGAKHFIWPPPKPEYHRSFQELPPVGSGTGPAAGAWNPNVNGDNTLPSYRAVNVNRRRPVWPPPSRQLVKQSSLPETSKARKLLDFEEYVRLHAGINVPPTYRAPPGTQYYEVQYEFVEE